MMLRPQQPASNDADDARDPGAGGRLNLLLSHGGWRDHSVVDQLPRLLEPMGIASIRVDTGDEASEAVQRFKVHIAVVDLAIPLHRCETEGSPATSFAGGQRLLQLLRRLDAPPPMVVVRPPQAAARDSARSLSQALREGAFAVLDRPVDLETMLETMRRVVRRYYADHWPAA